MRGEEVLGFSICVGMYGIFNGVLHVSVVKVRCLPCVMGGRVVGIVGKDDAKALGVALGYHLRLLCSTRCSCCC